MKRPVIASLVLVSGLWAPLAGQQLPSGLPTGGSLPTPQQAQQMLQGNPTLADSIRQRLRQSGMTPDQIRARLRASGYPESLMDSFLGPATPGQPAPPAGSYELSAIRALGLNTIALTDSLPLDTGFIPHRGFERVLPSRVFGVDAFRRTTNQYFPLLAGPVGPDYPLGPGDVLVLILTGDVQAAHTLEITREGFVIIPRVGQIFASNLTIAQLRDVLYARLGQVYSGVRRSTSATTHFDISVSSVRANQVYVNGEVNQPGAYQISALGTVLTALYAAGGVTERANMRAIEVRRGDRTVATFDLYDYLLRGVARTDIRLASGDVIFAPIHGPRVQVNGAVTRPAVYEMKPGETLVDLLRAAGGLRPDAGNRRVTVHRILPLGQHGPASAPRAALDVALSPAPAVPSPDVLGPVQVPRLELADGDSVVVDSLTGLNGSFHVSIAGMVRKPGMFPWRPDMTLRDLVLLARGPAVGAYLKEAEIARLPADRSQGALAETVRVPMDSTYLFERDSTGAYTGPPGLPFPAPGAPEVVLQPYDNVLIFGQPDFELQRSVTIQGQVRFPGTYSLLTKNDRLSALIERTGGVTPQAYTDGVRFIRTLGSTGRINVDLTEALRVPGGRADIILQPGDSVLVPEYQATVKVTGAVSAPGSVLYRQGAGLGYYLGAAGGFARNADKGAVSVRYANGDARTRSRFLFFTSSPAPGPGAEVFVPIKDTAERGLDWPALFGSLAQLLATTVTLIIVVNQATP